MLRAPRPSPRAVSTPLSFASNDVRVVTLEGEPWFVAADVCRCLGLDIVKGTGQHLSNLSADEKRPVTPGLIRGKGMNLAVMISESGLYRLNDAQQTKPQARTFQDWAARHVFPAIRKDGMYVMGEEKVATGGELAEARAVGTGAVLLAALTSRSGLDAACHRAMVLDKPHRPSKDKLK